MEFKKSPYYDEKILGQNLYDLISDDDEVLTIHEYFGINDNQKEYSKEGSNIYGETYSYKLTVYEDYYELDCQKSDGYLYLIFDKPVHITGEYCSFIIAPEISVAGDINMSLYCCFSNKVIISNNSIGFFVIKNSKIKDVHFYSSRVKFLYSEIDNFFILNKDLIFAVLSIFLDFHKIKCFGECEDLRKKILKNRSFKQGIIHIE